uniref:Uncharacterized protein n=1 Tax=Hucho hucho TaxID=62062 RepID=A0A4W5R272_9TELE
ILLKDVSFIVIVQEVAVPAGWRRRLNEDVLPFSAFLTDDICRRHSYLRVSMMEECNFRCKHDEGYCLQTI